MILAVKKQYEVSIYECENGDLAIKSDVDHLGEQVIYVTPENAILLGNALIRLAEESIEQRDSEEQES